MVATHTAAWLGCGRRCVAKLQSAGLKVLGDCVLNHRCASHQDSAGVWNQFGGRLDWCSRAIVGDDRNFNGRGKLRHPLHCSWTPHSPPVYFEKKWVDHSCRIWYPHEIVSGCCRRPELRVPI